MMVEVFKRETKLEPPVEPFQRLIAAPDILQKLWEKIAEIDVTTDVTTITITGLDILKDKAYVILFTVKNPTGTTSWYNLFVNGDTIETNYYSQRYYADGASVGAARGNVAYCFHCDAGQNAFGEALLVRDPSGYARARSSTCTRDGSSITIFDFAVVKTATVTNITRIDIVATVADAIGTGSKLLLFRVGR